jgi:hypothetical protein
VSDQEKADIFRSIVTEMIQFFVGSGLQCEQDGHRYTVSKRASSWWRGNGGRWSLVVVDGDVREAIHRLTPDSVHVLLSLWDIPDDDRQRLQSQGTVWIEIAKKEQSRYSNDLGDEVSNFLKRYGVRTLRIPPHASSAL